MDDFSKLDSWLRANDGTDIELLLTIVAIVVGFIIFSAIVSSIRDWLRFRDNTDGAINQPEHHRKKHKRHISKGGRHAY